jgi:hypothetical protein
VGLGGKHGGVHRGARVAPGAALLDVDRGAACAEAAAGTTGDVKAMAMYAGQGVALIYASEPAAHIVRPLAPTG